MNTVANDDPLGPEYWAAFENQVKRVEVDRNRHDERYGCFDPDSWGWRRPNPAELQRERREAVDE